MDLATILTVALETQKYSVKGSELIQDSVVTQVCFTYAVSQFVYLKNAVHQFNVAELEAKK